MGFSLDVSVPALTVFLQGLVSFFSPCVLPLLPLYIGYLSGGTRSVGEDGRIYYKRSKVMVNTIFFVVGVSFAFFLLGFGVSALGHFFNRGQLLFAKIGGIIVILFGLYQLGFLGTSTVLGREHRLPFRLDKMAMSPVTALIMGFTFSFAWTPCVGPALATVLIMAASAATKATGYALIGVYTLGFILPFLIVGLFTTTLLDFFKKHGQFVKYTVKIGGILMIIMGLLMFTGKMNAVTGYLSEYTTQSQNSGGQKTPEPTAVVENTTEESSEETAAESTAGTAETEAESQAEIEETTTAEPETLPAIDFTLTDQYGNTHTLSDYKGKTVFLNFWATWCPPCRAEMPDIQKIYETYSTEGDDALIVLGVAGPNQGREKSEDGIKQFLEDNGYTYPVLMDTTGEQFAAYGVYSLPTTFMIDKEGNVFGYASGQLNEDTMKSIIQQTMEGKRR
ncbi:cytochrome C biogenesis protein [Clostridium sp. chh4-2]|uniref:cytochrome c biogenesis protein/redoxin n=1 Tax=Clostridium sp. chh4-2 TaxID=2067550 RepID=UPI000CCE573B|nr:cytochrome c biogenesis protein/redoxin [Clostridium sp. chh4-2]PNV62280.1 cytochrome C biogenesis protein [Clostridium sp. chh4-2]